MTRPTPVGSPRLVVPGGRALVTAAATLALAGCAFEPEWMRLSRTAELERVRLSSEQFDHVVLLAENRDTPLYLLIGGDGTPWIRERRVAIDPTPANPLLLRLMTSSGQSAAYLGRPCYFGTATGRGCHDRYWTFERYGPAVVRSMCDVANRIVDRSAAGAVVLVGYSGGAAIASAMRGCVDRLAGFVSIAGNLDPAAWTRYHGYSPLADLPPLAGPKEFDGYEVHWQCESDEVVPPRVTRRYFEHNPAAERRLVDDCTHATGWESYWPHIISETAATRAPLAPRRA